MAPPRCSTSASPRLAIDSGGADAGSATITSPALTRQGIVLGTAAYMAPEQARGRLVDRRADLWAFGCVVYEMLTGHRLFQGETVSDTIAEVLRKDVPWSHLPPGTSPALVRLLRQCLQRDPARRLRDAGDVRLRLDAIDDEVPGPGEPTRSPERRSRDGEPWRALDWPRAALLIGLAAGWAASRPSAARDDRRRPSCASPSRRRTRWARSATWPSRPTAASWCMKASCPPGGACSFGAWTSQTHNRSKAPTADDGRSCRRMAAGSRSSARASCRRWRSAGGDALTLCDANGGPGAAWGPNGQILFAESWTGDEGLMSVSDQGGAPVRP
jgi:eukaryotic-like serine/threonine-protein kinase